MLRLLVLLALATLVSCDFDQELHNKFMTMERAEFVEYFNNRNYSYTIKAYNFEPVIGDVVMNRSIPKGVAVIVHSESSLADLPDNFDSKKKWSQCVTIGEVYEQGDCASSFAFATTSTISDRTCIHKDQTLRLSVQDFECFFKQYVCSPSGYIGNMSLVAFGLYIDEGFVTQECKPYDVERLKKGKCHKKCVNGKDYAGDKRIGTSHATISYHEETIKAELFHYGPIEATFDLYENFKAYGGGVYEHLYGDHIGTQSVKVVGYGIENGVSYWLAVNSWGKRWGKEGLFAVKRYAKDLNFESALYTSMP